MSFGTRFKRALDSANMSVRAFGRRLDDEGEKRVRGGSYPTLHRYLKDDASARPSAEFVDTAARILGVRPQWLMSGNEEMTETRQRASGGFRSTPLHRIASDQDEDDAQSRKAFWAGWKGGVHAGADKPTYERMPPVVQVVFGNALARLVLANPTALDPADRGRIAARLLNLAMRPFDEFMTDAPLDDSRAITDYMLAMLHGIMLAMPERDTPAP